MNGWFPKINKIGQIASGNNGIWLTDIDGKQKQVSPTGTNPFWAGDKLCYNRNDGTTQVGINVVPIAYNTYFGSESDLWTGFLSTPNGRVDFYKDIDKINTADGICLAKNSNNNLCYVSPYNNENRTLVYNNVPIFQGKVTNYILSSPSGLIAWQIATSTYGRQILNQSQIISIRTDEDPMFGFDFLGQTYIVSQTQIGQLIYPLGSHFGYFRAGELYYPDGKVFDNKLHLVGSDGNGEPLFDNYIDLLSPRQDLRLV